MEVDVVTEVLGKLRNCSYYGDLTGNFMDVAIAPIQQMYNNLGGKKKMLTEIIRIWRRTEISSSCSR